MLHKGEIIKKAVYQSGYSITKLAKDLGKSRRWVYQLFENSNVSTDVVLAIGNVIYHDFSELIQVMPKSSETNGVNPPNSTNIFWKDKYINLLEEYNDLLKKYLNSQK
jgi:predicted transcriptional regulator